MRRSSWSWRKGKRKSRGLPGVHYFHILKPWIVWKDDCQRGPGKLVVVWFRINFQICPVYNCTPLAVITHVIQAPDAQGWNVPRACHLLGMPPSLSVFPHQTIFPWTCLLISEMPTLGLKNKRWKGNTKNTGLRLNVYHLCKKWHWLNPHSDMKGQDPALF